MAAFLRSSESGFDYSVPRGPRNYDTKALFTPFTTTSSPGIGDESEIDHTFHRYCSLYVALTLRLSLADFKIQLQGLSTIQAFGWKAAFTESHIDSLDASQRAMFMRMSLGRWLNVVLDLLFAAVAIAFLLSATRPGHSLSAAQIGIALNLILASTTTLLRLVQSWTSLEISLESVQRLKSFEDMLERQQTSVRPLCPSLNWPSQGAIELKNVRASYGYVLRLYARTNQCSEADWPTLDQSRKL